MIIKVCGMREPQNIREVAALAINWIGFIFYDRSPRFVERCPTKQWTVDNGQCTVHANAKQLSTVTCQLSTKKVGVFVNASPESMMEKASAYKLDYLQLHGNESPEDCHTLQKRGYSLIKAFPIATKEDFEKTREYEGRVDYFLFDTRCEGYGGSGKRFDWSILTEYKGETPFLLSGGIRPENAEAIRHFRHPRFAGIDLNSGFEIEPGLKDIDKLKNFIQQILHPAVETGRAPSPTV
ncbi:phosphoribosylanthranilate isomerase [Parabacteroides sp.]